MAGRFIFWRMQMKSIKKLLFVMAALAAVFGLVACSDDDDDPSTVAVFEDSYTNAGAKYTETITFYDDGTFKNVTTIEGVRTFTAATGTYKGDVTKDTSNTNKVTYTVKKYANKKGELVSIEDAIKEELGAVAADELVKEILKGFTDASATITGKTLTCDLGTYTRK